MKDIFDKWENELESKMPSLRNDILNEPIPQKTALQPIKKKRRVSRYLTTALSVAAVLVLCICIIPLLNIENVDGQSTILTVEINPRVMVVSDENGIVTNVIATNKDADIVLSSEGFDEAVIGKPTTEAIISYVAFAQQLGYIDANSTENEIKITVADDDASKSILKSVKDNLEQHLVDNGVSVKITDKATTVDEICRINEIDNSESLDEIKEKFSNRSSLYSARHIEDLGEDEYKEYYKNSLVNDALKDEIRLSLEQIKELNSISKETEGIIELLELLQFPTDSELFESLESLKNNPLCPQEIKDAIQGLEDLVSEFEEKYGLKIESYSQLNALTQKYSDEYIDELLNGVENLDDKNLEEYKSLLDSFGKNTDTLDKIINMPQSKEDILKRIEEDIKQESSNRIEENKNKQTADKNSDEPSVPSSSVEKEEENIRFPQQDRNENNSTDDDPNGIDKDPSKDENNGFFSDFENKFN